MSFVRRLSRALAVLSATGGILVMGAPAGAAVVPPGQGPVRPHQDFGAHVNGKLDDAAIAMACFGPIRPGQRAHPMGGQTLDVFRPEVLRTHGYTGESAHRIVAHFSDDPTVTVTFYRYAQPKAIPTSLRLPCSGSGKVTFTPEPTSPTARPQVVHVSYVGQP